METIQAVIQQTHNLPADRKRAEVVQSSSYSPLSEDQKGQLMQVLAPADYRIIMAERTGLQLRLLSNDDLHDTVLDIMSEVKLITGAIVYEDFKMMEIQAEMIGRFLAGGFALLTKEEVIQAFYLNAQGRFEEVYRHFNKELNAEFIGDVLRAYMRYKRQFKDWNRTRLMQILSPRQIKQPPVTVDWDFWKDQVQKEYEAYIMGKSCLQMWHYRKYYALRKFGRLPFKGIETWEWFLKKAIESGDYETTLGSGPIDLRHYRFKTAGQMRRIFLHREQFNQCLDYARRYAYWYMLSTFRKTGIKNIWEDIA